MNIILKLSSLSFLVLLHSGLTAMDSKLTTQSVPLLSDLCIAKIISEKQNGQAINTDILPQELRGPLHMQFALGKNATEVIEKNIVRCSSDSLLRALCLYNKTNKTAQQLLGQLRNIYPQDLYADFIKSDSYRLYRSDQESGCLVAFNLLTNKYKDVDPLTTIKDPSFAGMITLQDLASRLVPFVAYYHYEPGARYLVNRFNANIKTIGHPKVHGPSQGLTALDCATSIHQGNFALAKSVLDLGALRGDNESLVKNTLLKIDEMTRYTGPNKNKDNMVSMLLNYGIQQQKNEL